MLFYVQCKVRKKITGDNTGTNTYKVMTSWLPEKHAKLNKWVKLKNRETKEWEDHWQIVALGAKKAESLVMDKERDYLEQREASDV